MKQMTRTRVFHWISHFVTTDLLLTKHRCTQLVLPMCDIQCTDDSIARAVLKTILGNRCHHGDRAQFQQLKFQKFFSAAQKLTIWMKSFSISAFKLFQHCFYMDGNVTFFFTDNSKFIILFVRYFCGFTSELKSAILMTLINLWILIAARRANPLKRSSERLKKAEGTRIACNGAKILKCA